MFVEKQQAFYKALKDAQTPYTEAALYNLETFNDYYSVGVTCKMFNIDFMGKIKALIQYPDGQKLSFNGYIGGGFISSTYFGSGVATNIPGNLLGETSFELQFSPIQMVATFYKQDGVACNLILAGALYPEAPGYLNGSGTWEYGW